MTVGLSAPPDRAIAPVRTAIRPEFGWRRNVRGPIELWTKGYGLVEDGKAALDRLVAFGSAPAVSDISRFVEAFDGHFAVAAIGPGWAFAAVDRTRSIPLAFASCDGTWCIDDQARRLRDRASLGHGAIDPDAVLSLAMSGYTIDVATLYRGLEQLGPGELVLFVGSDAPIRHRYYRYRPWRGDKPAFDLARARKSLANVTLDLIDGMMRSLGGRPLAVPLSAGRDSRLIVSAARHLGYRNILTFAYGHPGNFEAKASRAVAERLGLPWQFVPTGTTAMRRYFAGETHASYCAFADTLQAVPFVQDLVPIAALKADGYLPAEAVLCNGNSGDFISGAHIVPAMQDVTQEFSADERLKRITSALLDKHFALWKSLQTADNRATIERQLVASLRRADAGLGDPADDYGVYEYAEFQDRQCKYVITGERIYEFLGHDWRLPLWDRTYLDFFELVPLAGKVGQRLYSEMLTAENWGGVWQGLPVNAKTVRPHWLRPIRFMAKVAHAPLGRTAWHATERRYFQYWMEQSGHSAVRSYIDVIRDPRGARHGIAWLTEAYLASHGIEQDRITAFRHA